MLEKFQIQTVERQTMSDFLLIKPETKSLSSMFPGTNTHWYGSVKHVKNIR